MHISTFFALFRLDLPLWRKSFTPIVYKHKHYCMLNDILQIDWKPSLQKVFLFV